MMVLGSCSVYRSGQTPDDVYYSPAREEQSAAAYVPADGGRNDGRRYNDRQSYSGYDDYATPEDRWLMMRVRNRTRWSMFDDYGFYSPYSPYGGMGWGLGYNPGWSFGLGLGYGGFYDPYGLSYYNHFNNYWMWNSFYNPYYPSYIIVNPKINPVGYNTVRNFNLRTYNNNAYNNNRNTLRPRVNYGTRYNNANDNYRTGSSSRRTYNNSTLDRSSRETYRNPSSDRPVRTYSPSNSSPSYSPRSSGSSGGGGGSRPVRR